MKKAKESLKAFYRVIELPVFFILYVAYVLYWILIQRRDLDVKGIMDGFGYKIGKALPVLTVLAWAILIISIRNHPGIIKGIFFIAAGITLLFVLVPEILVASKIGFNASSEGVKAAMRDYSRLMPEQEPRPNPYPDGSIEHAAYAAMLENLVEKWPKHKQRPVGEAAIDDLLNHNENRNPYNDMEFEYYVYNFAYEYFKNKRENQTAGPDQN